MSNIGFNDNAQVEGRVHTVNVFENTAYHKQHTTIPAEFPGGFLLTHPEGVGQKEMLRA